MANIPPVRLLSPMQGPWADTHVMNLDWILTTLRDGISTINSGVEAINAALVEVEGLAGEVKQYDQRITTNTQDIASLSDLLDSLSDDLTAVSNKTAESAGKLVTLSGTVEGLDSEVKRINREVENTEYAVQQLNSVTVPTLRADIASNRSAIYQQEDTNRELQEAIGSEETTRTEQVRDLRERVGTLEVEQSQTAAFITPQHGIIKNDACDLKINLQYYPGDKSAVLSVSGTVDFAKIVGSEDRYDLGIADGISIPQKIETITNYTPCGTPDGGQSIRSTTWTLTPALSGATVTLTFYGAAGKKFLISGVPAYTK